MRRSARSTYSSVSPVSDASFLTAAARSFGVSRLPRDSTCGYSRAAYSSASLSTRLERPAAELAVVVRDGGVRREVERVRPVVALVLEVDRRQVEHAGDQHQPVDVHAVPALEMLDQRRTAQGPVGLAGDELRRHPALVPRRPDPDQLADRLDVALVAVERLGLGALQRAGVAGRHRVDEDQVADREQGLGVVGRGRTAARSSAPASPISTRRGPRRPRCSHTLELPGPPLKANVTGRRSGRRRRGCRRSWTSRPWP